MHIYAHFTASVDPLPALLKNNEYLPPMRAFPGPAARLQQLFQRFTACTTIRCVLTRVHRSLSILADARPDRLCVPAYVCLLLLSCLLLQGAERFACSSGSRASRSAASRRRAHSACLRRARLQRRTVPLYATATAPQVLPRRSRLHRDRGVPLQARRGPAAESRARAPRPGGPRKIGTSRRAVGPCPREKCFICIGAV